MKLNLEKYLSHEQLIIEIVTNCFTTLYIFLNMVSLKESAKHFIQYLHYCLIF